VAPFVRSRSFGVKPPISNTIVVPSDGVVVVVVGGVVVVVVGGVVVVVGGGGLLVVVAVIVGFELHPIMEAIKTKLVTIKRRPLYLLFINNLHLSPLLIFWVNDPSIYHNNISISIFW
jgi:hypothetical protein